MHNRIGSWTSVAFYSIPLSIPLQELRALVYLMRERERNAKVNAKKKQRVRISCKKAESHHFIFDYSGAAAGLAGPRPGP
jgi:hypothetical protein